MEGALNEEDCCIVAEWLHTLNLVQYTQAFIDNGYDDLEICKQIGDPDLDAIGVTKPDHREEILDAVRSLSSQDTSHLYYILENRNYEEQKLRLKRDSDDCGNDEQKDGIITDEYAEGRKAFVTFPKLHLCAIVRDKLAKHGIKLTQKPFINEDGSLNHDALEEISKKFASDLKTHPQDVLDRLHDLMELESSPSEQEPEVDGDARSDGYTLYSLCGPSSRSVPPPLPSCPPPPASSRHASVSSRTSRHVSPSAARPQTEHDGIFREVNSFEEITELDNGLEPEKNGRQSGTLGKFIGTIRGKSAKKYSYKKIEGDLNASEITMGDEERIQLMLMVKEGTITKDEAVEAVKMYETRRRKEMSEMGSSSSAECYNSPKPARHCGKISPFLLFKFASQRRKKSSASQDVNSQSSSSITSSPELSSSHPVKLYEGTGTQMYSPVQGVRKKVSEKSPGGFFSSPKSSPARQSRWSKAVGHEGENTPSPKSKKKGSFSSPFSIRKKSSSQSKDLWESPRISLSSLQNDSGVFVSPSGSRHGSFTLTQEIHAGAKRSPVLRTVHQDLHFPFDSAHQETVAFVHHSPHRTPPLNPKLCDNPDATGKQMTFQTFNKRLSEDFNIAAPSTYHNNRDERVRRARSPGQTSRQSSESCERCNHVPRSSNTSLNQCDIAAVKSRDNSQESLGNKDSISPKRRNSPTDSPCDPQSPKRQHFSTSPDSTFGKAKIPGHPKYGATSPDQGIDTSPTGTMESARGSHFGSSSTMSVGSETSPSCTIERSTLKAHKKLLRRTLDEQRRRSHSFSTADEYLSSDPDELQEKKLERNNQARRSLVETVKVTDTKGQSRTSAETAGMVSNAVRINFSKNGGAVSSSESRSSMSVEEEGARSRRLHTRSRPQTVESILQRLGLSHLIQKFKAHRILDLAIFSDLDERDLNELGIHSAEERAKLLTAAQMISDFEERTSESAPSSVCSSPCRAATNAVAAQKAAARPQSTGNGHSLLVPGPQYSHTPRPASPSSSLGALPYYENIDNFDRAIPDDERFLTNIGCQCEFDPELSQIVHVDISPDDKQDSRFYSAQSYPHYNNGSRTMPKSKPKPQVPERTVSLLDNTSSSSTSSPSVSPVKYKDASTQHGGILHMLMRSGSLVTSSPSPGGSKVKTAEITLLKMPNHTGRHAATMPKLCAHHRQSRQTPDKTAEKAQAAVRRQLLAEHIDLTIKPFSSHKGECGIPATLVQRYAEELQVDLYDAATAFETLRIGALKAVRRSVIHNPDFADHCLNPAAYDLAMTSVQDFVISLGFPQYATLFLQHSIQSIEQLVNNVHSDDLYKMGITNSAHIKRLRHGVKQLRHRKSLQDSALKLNQPKRTDSGYSTIDAAKSGKGKEKQNAHDKI